MINLFAGVDFTKGAPLTVGTFIAAGLTLCIYSFLYKDNPFYKFAEHVYVGVSTGYLLVIMWVNALKPFLYTPMADPENRNLLVIVPGLLGLLMFTRFFQKYSWLSRFTLAFIIGAGAGISAPNQVHGWLLRHSQATLEVFTLKGMTSQWAVIDGILIFVGVISVLIYFFFSIQHNKALRGVSKIGVIYLMVFFGAAFGYTVMGRVSLLIGRIRFLLIDWIGLGR